MMSGKKTVCPPSLQTPSVHCLLDGLLILSELAWLVIRLSVLPVASFFSSR